MTKNEIIENFNSSYIVEINKTDYSDSNLKLIWLVEDLLDIITDDTELSINIGRDILKLLRDIYNSNNELSFAFKSNYDLYKRTIVYKNLLEEKGFNLEYGVSYRCAWFDYNCENFIINEDDMKWFLFKFMNMEV